MRIRAIMPSSLLVFLWLTHSAACVGEALFVGEDRPFLERPDGEAERLPTSPGTTAQPGDASGASSSSILDGGAIASPRALDGGAMGFPSTIDSSVVPAQQADGTVLACSQAACDPGLGLAQPAQVTVEIGGATTFFADGAQLPAGKYRVSYVDGCMAWGQGDLYGWTVHGYNPFFVVGDFDVAYQVVPGTWGATIADGAFPTIDGCVAANRALCPVDFMFLGGRLGITAWGFNQSAGIQTVGGETVGARSPTYELVQCQ